MSEAEAFEDASDFCCGVGGVADVEIVEFEVVVEAVVDGEEVDVEVAFGVLDFGPEEGEACVAELDEFLVGDGVFAFDRIIDIIFEGGTLGVAGGFEVPDLTAKIVLADEEMHGDLFVGADGESDFVGCAEDFGDVGGRHAVEFDEGGVGVFEDVALVDDVVAVGEGHGEVVFGIGIFLCPDAERQE